MLIFNILINIDISIDYILAGTILCSNRSCTCNDVFERIQRTMVPLYVSFCSAIFLYYTNQLKSKSGHGQGVLCLVYTKR